MRQRTNLAATSRSPALQSEMITSAGRAVLTDPDLRDWATEHWQTGLRMARRLAAHQWERAAASLPDSPAQQARLAEPSAASTAASPPAPTTADSPHTPAAERSGQPSYSIEPISGGMNVTNPAANHGAIRFLVNRHVIELQPGEAHQFPPSDSWNIQYHPGGDFDNVQRTVSAGNYEFRVTRRGWRLEPASH